jgi:hypothetical protein
MRLSSGPIRCERVGGHVPTSEAPAFVIRKHGATRTHRADGEHRDWLLITLKDKYIDSLPEDLEDRPESVLTG